MVDCECSNISVRWPHGTSERHILRVFISPAYQCRVFVYFCIYIKASTVVPAKRARDDRSGAPLLRWSAAKEIPWGLLLVFGVSL